MKKYNIAVFGAFNVDSFGDSMFPKAIYNEISKRIELQNMFVFSPMERDCGYNNNGHIYSYDQFGEVCEKCSIDAIIVGGGELLHNLPIMFKDGAQNEIIYEEGVLWKKPIKFGMRYNIPVVINSVGMPYDFSDDEKNEFWELFSNVKYISLRDVYSYKRFLNAFENLPAVALVPDSLWRIKDYFEEKELDNCACNLSEEYGFPVESYLAFQYGMLRGFEETLDVIEQFCRGRGLKPVAFAINACHEDFDLIHSSIAKNRNTVFVERILSPQEIVALISNANIFVGTSLHGNLTAQAYGVKSVIIDMYPEFVSKMDGLSEMLLTDNNFANKSTELWAILNQTYDHGYCSDYLLEKFRSCVAENFERICEVIQGGSISCSLTEEEAEEKGGVPLFRKSYLEVWGENGLSYWDKCIGKMRDGRYQFKYQLILDGSEQKIALNFPLKNPCKINVIKTNFRILSSNEVQRGIFIDDVAEIVINPFKNLERGLVLECQFEELIVPENMTAIYARYKNKQMHVELLEHRERKYLGIIRENDIDKEKLKEEVSSLRNKQEELERESIKRETDFAKREKELVQELNEKEASFTKREANFRRELNEKEASFAKLEAELRQEILNKEGRIELLLPPEREYKKIINSKMFKVMRFICRTYDIVMIVPRFIVRNVYAFARMMTHVNRQELKIAFGYVRNEGLRGAYRHLMRDYHQGQLRQIRVEAEEPEKTETKTIEDYELLELPECQQPVVSIVIPAYNQFAYTYNCIASIISNSGDVPYEVILADDCSSDLTTEIDKVIKNLVIAKTEENMLFLRNCNHAAQYARGKYILFLNNDTQVQKDWLQPLVDLIESSDDIGMVGSKLVYADGALQEAGGILWKDGSAWNYGRDMDAMMPEYNYVREVDYISGASIMIDANLWKKLGGFDELFAPAYCEDSDLAFQVRKAGYRVMYQPLSVVVHFEGKSNGTDLNSGVKKYQVENNLKLRKKWAEEFDQLYENGQNVFNARERGRNRKTILVVDHYVPQFDKDAGSKTTFQYLKMFIKQGYRVKFVGDNFYQHEPYTTVLQQMGIEVLYGPWYAQHWQEWILENKRFIDFAYLNRPHITVKYIDFIRKNTDIKCIYYGHDLHFLRLRREYEITGDESKREESEDWLAKELSIMRKTDMNYYPSCVEEEEIRKIDARIPVKAITAYVYEKFLTDINEDFAMREGIMFVGGFGHPPNEDAVLWFAEKVFPLISKEREIPFYVIGSNPTDKILKLKGRNTIIKGFVSEEELRKLYNTCKLVVVPLRYGAGVKGKVVEALYYGTPMVTTSVGIEGIGGAEEIIEVADSAENFAGSVLKLYEDNEKLAKISEAYQVFVKQMFGVEAVWNVVKDDFQ